MGTRRHGISPHEQGATTSDRCSGGAAPLQAPNEAGQLAGAHPPLAISGSQALHPLLHGSRAGSTAQEGVLGCPTSPSQSRAPQSTPATLTVPITLPSQPKPTSLLLSFPLKHPQLQPVPPETTPQTSPGPPQAPTRSPSPSQTLCCPFPSRHLLRHPLPETRSPTLPVKPVPSPSPSPQPPAASPSPAGAGLLVHPAGADVQGHPMGCGAAVAATLSHALGLRRRPSCRHSHGVAAPVGAKGLCVQHNPEPQLTPACFLTQPEVKGAEQRLLLPGRAARVGERLWPRGGLQVPTPEPPPEISLAL